VNNASLLELNDEGINPPLRNSGNYAQALPNKMPVPLEGKTFRRLLAERDILPEIADPNNIKISNNGGGLTNAIQNFINRSNLPSELIESEVLDALNSIFSHDALFTDIVLSIASK
jgi:putative ATP-dependent endonuclease of OLD family